MALDGMFLRIIKNRIEQLALDSRIDKIHQPSKDEIIILLRSKCASHKLLLSANPSNSRIHFTNTSADNPKSPPMFCMLLRKHFGGGKLINVRQLGLDRILFLDFETINELGDVVTLTLCIEVMGRHSNIIAINENNRIIDAIKRVSEETSSVRPILPGMEYSLPPAQNKVNLLEAGAQQAAELFEHSANEDIAKGLSQTFEGISPILARELEYSMTWGMPMKKSELNSIHYGRLYSAFNDIYSKLNSEIETEVYLASEILSDKTLKPKDFTIIDIKQYGNSAKIQKFTNCDLLLDTFYSERTRIERMKQRSNDLLKFILNRIERTNNKIAVWKEELRVSSLREEYKIKGDLISANLYNIKQGDTSVTVDNFYDPDYNKITIELNPELSPSQNAQKYYSDYRKASNAIIKLEELLLDAENEITYLDSVWDLITRTTSEDEIKDIKEELAQQGIIKFSRIKANKGNKPQPPLKYKSTDGFTILCGRNNIQNDKLTLKDSKNYDMWLHTQKIAGSHVIIVADGKQIPDSTIEQAAVIAAYNSKARNSTQVAVDYTLIKNVKKPRGAKPGMVIFDNYSTAYVTPDESIVNSLSVK